MCKVMCETFSVHRRGFRSLNGTRNKTPRPGSPWHALFSKYTQLNPYMAQNNTILGVQDTTLDRAQEMLAHE